MKRVLLSICPLVIAALLIGALVLALQLKAEAAPPALISDDFEDGNADGWTEQAGNWSVVPEYSSYRVIYSGSSPSTRRSYYNGASSSNWDDYAIQTRVMLESGQYAMVMARYQDSNHYYFMTVRSNGDVEIKRYASGSTTLGTCSSSSTPSCDIALDTWYTATLEVDGSTVRAYIDGTPVLTATDTTFITGTVALGSSQGTAQFDDVVVTESGTATVLLDENFDDGMANDWTEQAGEWEIFANQVYKRSYVSGDSSTGRSYAGALEQTDYAVQARVKVFDGDYAIVMARYQDSNHYYFMTVRSNGKVEIKRYTGGSTTLGTCSSSSTPSCNIALDTWYTATLEVDGSTVRAYIDGTPVLTATDTTFITGTVALGSSKSNVYFDDVVVTDLSMYTLTVSKAGSGLGTVTSVPAGIDCGATCSAGFDAGTVVTLTATPDGSDSFVGWMGAGCSGTGTCVVTMDAAKDVTAIFSSAANPTLIVLKDGAGSGTVTSDPAGINCGGTCIAGFSASTVVTLTAAADTGSTFAGWSGAGCSGTDVCVVTMDAVKTVTATFVQGPFDLDVTKSGNGDGTVTSDPVGIDCGVTCTYMYDASTVVTLTATADVDSVFAGWSGGGCSGTGDCVVTMLADTNVTAAFMSLTQTLSVSKTGNGTGSVASDPAGVDCGATCSADYSYGSAVTLTATADGDSTFAGWSGACSGTGMTCTVTMDDTQNVIASFMSLTQTLSVAKTGSGTGSVASDPAGIDCGGTCSADYSYGTAVTLTAAPDAESAFIGWDGGGCSGTGDCVVTMDDTKAVTAAFKFNATLPFTDDFESGSGQWTVNTGDWEAILENQAYRVYYPGSGTSSMRSYYDGPYASTWTDYAIETRVKVESGQYAMVMARYQDSSNYYFMTVRGDNGKVEIKKYASGSTTLGTCSSSSTPSCNIARDTWYTVKLEVSGDTTPVLRASVDGTVVLTVTDTSGSPLTAGTCALGSSKSTAQFDDVVVTVIAPLDGIGSGDLMPATTLLIEDFEDGVADDWAVQAVIGNWSVVANHVYHTVYTEGVSTSTAKSYVGAPTWTDYSFEAKVKPISGTYAMLMTRWQDEDNYYLMALRLNNGKVEVKRMTPTGSIGLGSVNANITAGEWYLAKFEVEGDQLRCYIDGELILTLTDDVLTWGEVGVGTLRANADFDDVLVTSLVPTYTLTVDTTGSGTGSVTSDPVGLIDCGITCTATLERGTVVTLTATPDGGDTFAGWMGACSGTGDCVVTMDEAKDVTAVFSDPTNPMLIVHKDGTGTGTVTSVPAGIDCGITCTFGFPASTVVTLTATPTASSEFTGWSGEGCSGTGTCVVTMDVARTVTATFTHVAYPLTVIKDGSGTGTVTSEPAGIDCGITCTINMSGGVTLTATPDTMSSFTGWTGEGCSGTGTCVVTMDAAKTVTATFETHAYYLPLTMVYIEPVVVNPLYIAPNGDDSNPGTMALPFKTVSKAVSVAVAGQTIYMRDGTYYYTETVTLAESGNPVNMYKIWAYPGEQPVLDFSGVTPGSLARGFLITGNFWHLKGLEIQYAPDNGVKVEGSYNIVEKCVFHHNQDTGLQIGFGSTPSNADGLLAAYNQIINCDSYRNYDEATHGSNADGFACKLHAGKGNIFTGCRAWENSDDGWDLFQTYFPVTIENSWTWHNGDKDLLGYSGTSWGGNGNGFKVGGNYYEAAHILTGCIAFDNAYESGKGFDQNHDMGSITVYNSVAWGNLTNFSFNEDPTDGGTHILRNNVSFDAVTADTALAPSTVHDHNSWNLAVTASVTDFVSLDENLAKAARQADGSLPDNGFARLVAGSDLIDQGVDVGLPYCGAAPDLGAFEYCSSPDMATLPIGGLAATLGGGALGMLLTNLPKKRRQDIV